MKKLIEYYNKHWSNSRPKPEGWVQRYPDIPERAPVEQLPMGWFFIPMAGMGLFLGLILQIVVK